MCAQQIPCAGQAEGIEEHAHGLVFFVRKAFHGSVGHIGVVDGHGIRQVLDAVLSVLARHIHPLPFAFYGDGGAGVRRGEFHQIAAEGQAQELSPEAHAVNGQFADHLSDVMDQIQIVGGDAGAGA